MTPYQTTVTVRRALEKWPAFDRLGIEHRSCPSAGFWETNPPGGRPTHALCTAFHNQAPAAAAIPSWQANPGLCSSRAIEFLRPELPATSPFLCATSAPAGRSNSLQRESPPATVTRTGRFLVFTHTQSVQKTRDCHTFALAYKKPVY